MDFKNFSELREFIRRYNSTSILEIGTKKCWQKWEIKSSDRLYHPERNCAVRLMLLASAGNPHRHKNINVQVFDSLVKAYLIWDKHTISDERILAKEANILLSSIQQWETNCEKEVRNWSLKLSDILDLEVVCTHVPSLFLQRLEPFQNGGFGHPYYRIKRTIKLIELLDKLSSQEFSYDFANHVGLSPENYFRQFFAVLCICSSSEKRGFCNISQLSNLDDQVQKLGITSDNLKLFIQKNSSLFSSQRETSFRSKIKHRLNSVDDYYQPFFYNYFLEIPLVKLNDQEFCLPDPWSFTESCWNQVGVLISKDRNRQQLLSRAFEDYLENVLLPFICFNSFEKIHEVKKPNSSKDKRADFLIRTPNSYIIVECKSCVMNVDTSAYFQADKLGDLWCRIHSASQQIAMTVKALNLHEKSVIPLILTFYDSMAASTVFENMVEQTDYCSRMGLNMSPIVRSLHEFEHEISDRSLNNWSEFILAKQNPCIKPDNKGHDYKHLNDISIL